MRKKLPSERGFTLVELLVVIGIIAVLIGILLPALNKARASSQTIQCASALHQWGLALQMYVDANQGLVPFKGFKGMDNTADCIGPGSPAQNPTTGIDDSSVWYNALPSYLGTETLYQTLADHYEVGGTAALPGPGSNSLFVCPSGSTCSSLDTTVNQSKGYDAPAPDGNGFMYWMQDGTGVVASKVIPQQREIYLSYAFNSQLLSACNAPGNKYFALKMASCQPSSTIPVLVERLMSYQEYQDPAVQQIALRYPANQGKSITAQGYTGEICQPLADLKRFTTRHNGGGNILFFDGHVDFFKWGDAQGPMQTADYNVNTGTINWSIPEYGEDLY